jgi:hypothetical protein
VCVSIHHGYRRNCSHADQWIVHTYDLLWITRVAVWKQFYLNHWFAKSHHKRSWKTSLMVTVLITVAARSKAWTVFARSNAGIVRSNPTQGTVSVQWALSKGPNWVGVLPHHLRTETDPVSEISCSLVLRTPDDGKVQEATNSECYTPSSEPFRIYWVKNASVRGGLRIMDPGNLCLFFSVFFFESRGLKMAPLHSQQIKLVRTRNSKA